MKLKVLLMSVLVTVSLVGGTEGPGSDADVPGPGDLICQLFPALCE